MKNIIKLWYLSSILLTVISCSKMNDPIAPFIEGGEISYATKVDSLKSFSGRNRVGLTWELPANHSAHQVFAFWNKDQDSVELLFKPVKGKLYEAEIKNLQEATYLFDIYSFDKEGNRSIKTLTSVNVYGERYEATLLNRILLSAKIDVNDQLIAVFANAEEGNVGTEIVYTDILNKQKNVNVDRLQNEIVIADWKIGTPVLYRSSYKPKANAIDTFYVKEAETMKITKDISAQYLKNFQQPFLPVQQAGRFRDPLNWIVNAAVQNHSGMGGWSTDDNTVLNMESGWGAPHIVNGKMYQTTTLPKGDYSLLVELGAFGLGSSTVKIAAVPGQVMPDFDSNKQVPGAYGSINLELKGFDFTVSNDGPVTIGFIANMTGDQYWRVRKIMLYRNY
ncbi:MULTISPECIES: DUF4998 domain-containing protein [unclassified Sphingobacterium]|uniref:DUF4998 domain-containing protein n=1 Tax=unclassified Sphingobacterium TaxID=2609468 RepID=UPI00104742BD|nr:MULTISPECIES: DUF4998 domain-containing protein [unclassified Sphingobacterium]MCS3554257.1 hypothetical protein [Sphingobacterium sp. JUb21]